MQMAIKGIVTIDTKKPKPKPILNDDDGHVDVFLENHVEHYMYIPTNIF
jgi:hypothetical protein